MITSRMIQAIEAGDLDEIKACVRSGIFEEEPIQGETPSPMDTYNIEKIKLFLWAGVPVDIDIGGCTPLFAAVMRRDKECVNILLAAGADVNHISDDGYSVLHAAVYSIRQLDVPGSDSYEIMNTILTHGGNPNISDFDQVYPIYEAIDKNRPDVIRVLLEYGASKDVLNDEDQTPLIYAVSAGKPDCVSELIEAGSDTEGVLHYVLSKMDRNYSQEDENMEIFRMLLNRDTDLNALNRDGLAPIHIAIRKNRYDIVEELLDAGANIEVRDDKKNTPLQLAVQKNKASVIQELIQRGANTTGSEYHYLVKLHIQKLRIAELEDQVLDLQLRPGGPVYDECRHDFYRAARFQ